MTVTLNPIEEMSTMPVYDDISPRTNNEQELLEVKANLAYIMVHFVIMHY